MIDISIITPMYNGVGFIDDLVLSVVKQSVLKQGKMVEWIVCDDNSNDGSYDVLEQMKPIIRASGIDLILLKSTSRYSCGAGATRNRAISVAKGKYLAFQDADDIMYPNRLEEQLRVAYTSPTNTLIGSLFIREPEDATKRYTFWLNNLTHEQLKHQRFRECTLLLPTWFIDRQEFLKIGFFDEDILVEPLIMKNEKPMTFNADSIEINISSEEIRFTRKQKRELKLQEKSARLDFLREKGYITFECGDNQTLKNSKSNVISFTEELQISTNHEPMQKEEQGEIPPVKRVKNGVDTVPLKNTPPLVEVIFEEQDMRKYTLQRVPEDFIWFQKFIDGGGELKRVDEILLTYRYHSNSISMGSGYSISSDSIFNVKFKCLEKIVLPKWQDFGIWSFGVEGKRLYKALSPENKQKVRCFYDIDEKKLRNKVYFDPDTKRKIPLLHWSVAAPRFITCVKYMLTENAEFEKNLESLKMIEGTDYYFFS